MCYLKKDFFLLKTLGLFFFVFLRCTIILIRLYLYLKIVQIFCFMITPILKICSKMLLFSSECPDHLSHEASRSH